MTFFILLPNIFEISDIRNFTISEFVSSVMFLFRFFRFRICNNCHIKRFDTLLTKLTRLTRFLCDFLFSTFNLSSRLDCSCFNTRFFCCCFYFHIKFVRRFLFKLTCKEVSYILEPTKTTIRITTTCSSCTFVWFVFWFRFNSNAKIFNNISSTAEYRLFAAFLFLFTFFLIFVKFLLSTFSSFRLGNSFFGFIKPISNRTCNFTKTCSIFRRFRFIFHINICEFLLIFDLLLIFVFTISIRIISKNFR